MTNTIIVGAFQIWRRRVPFSKTLAERFTKQVALELSDRLRLPPPAPMNQAGCADAGGEEPQIVDAAA